MQQLNPGCPILFLLMDQLNRFGLGHLQRSGGTGNTRLGIGNEAHPQNMGDASGNELAGKAVDHKIVGSQRLGQDQAQMGHGTLAFMGKLVEDRWQPGKRTIDFGFGNARKAAGRAGQIGIVDEFVTCALEQGLNDGVLAAKSAAENGDRRHIDLP